MKNDDARNADNSRDGWKSKAAQNVQESAKEKAERNDSTAFSRKDIASTRQIIIDNLINERLIETETKTNN